MKVVLDTHIIVSALLRGGETKRFHDLWVTGHIRPLASQAMLEEYVRVLSYPKFGFTPEFVARLLSEALIPYLTKVEEWRGKLPYPPSDATDEKFIRSALESGADALVSGDAHLIALEGKYPFPILKPSVFLARMDGK